MPITGIDAVVFGVEDMATAGRFLDDWGLKRIGAGEYECRDRSRIVVEPVETSGLKPIETGPTTRAVIWGASDARTVDTIASDLARDRKVTADADGTAWAEDDMGLRIGIRVTRREPIVSPPYQPNTPGFSGRVDERAPYYQRAVPQEISHVVFGVRDIAPVEAFYRQRLGFLVSDRYVGRAVFLRGAPAGNHHHLFLLNSADAQTHFNHVCFKVRNIHEVIGGGQFISEKGWPTLEGPGRHIVSSACFWYFKSPVAGGFEYAADEDMVTENWKAGEFEASAMVFSEWRFNAPKDGRLVGPIASSRAVGS